MSFFAYNRSDTSNRKIDILIANIYIYIHDYFAKYFSSKNRQILK